MRNKSWDNIIKLKYLFFKLSRKVIKKKINLNLTKLKSDYLLDQCFPCKKESDGKNENK